MARPVPPIRYMFSPLFLKSGISEIISFIYSSIFSVSALFGNRDFFISGIKFLPSITQPIGRLFIPSALPQENLINSVLPPPMSITTPLSYISFPKCARMASKSYFASSVPLIISISTPYLSFIFDISFTAFETPRRLAVAKAENLSHGYEFALAR